MESTQIEFEEGMPVEIVDTFNGTRVVGTGNVERLTGAQVIVRDQHGNETRFWKKNRRCLGYVWPNVTKEVRPARPDAPTPMFSARASLEAAPPVEPQAFSRAVAADLAEKPGGSRTIHGAGIKQAADTRRPNAAHKSNQTLRKLRDRLTAIIEENERTGRAGRNDAPVYFEFNLERGRGSWYVPLDFASSGLLGFEDEAGDKIEAIIISGAESKAVKRYQHRARRGTGGKGR